MANLAGSGILNVNANGWASSSLFNVKAMTFIFSADAGSIILNDRHGDVIARADNGTNIRTIHQHFDNKKCDGIVAATWTNATAVLVHLE